MHIADEADKIIEKLRGPQRPVFLIVYARPEESFEIVKGHYEIHEVASASPPAGIKLRKLYEAHTVLCITNETVPKSRSNPALGYHGLLEESLRKFPALLEQLQEHFPYRDFK